MTTEQIIRDLDYIILNLEVGFYDSPCVDAAHAAAVALRDALTATLTADVAA